MNNKLSTITNLFVEKKLETSGILKKKIITLVS